MAEEFPGSDVSKVTEDDCQEMECESSDLKSTQPAETEEGIDRRATLTLPTSGTISRDPSSTGTVTDSGFAKSPEGMSGQESMVSPPGSTVPSGLTSPITDGSSVKTDMLSPGKEKVGFLKGMKTAIKTKAKSVWKKISPKKSDKAALAVNTQEELEEASGPALPAVTEKPETGAKSSRDTKNRGSLVLNSIASEETTLLTSIGMSSSEVFLSDERRESVATCDTATHASRLPSLDESYLGNDPGESTQKQVSDQNILVDSKDEDTDDGNGDVATSPCERKENEE